MAAVRYEQEGRKARLTIDREAQRNSISAEVLRELAEHLDRAGADPGVGCVLLTGAGERTFCAGADLGMVPQGEGILASNDARRAYGQLLLKLARCPKPSVAVVNGLALAGGVGLVLACDLAVMADDAALGLPEIDRGLFPFQVMGLLSRHVGRKRALELALTGQRIPAKQAEAWGLVNRAVPRAELWGAANALADALAAKSSAVMALGRRAFYAAEPLAPEPAMEHLAGQLSLNALMEDAAEGVTAFFEKREPVWKNK